MSTKDLLLVPNLLTLLRILLVFPTLWFYDQGLWEVSMTIAICMFLTDFADGWIARKFQQSSMIGAILDPVADKLVVLSLFGYFFFQSSVPLWYYVLILIRDISQLSAVPILLFWKKIQFHVKPKMIPKWGTALNFILLGGVALQPIWEIPLLGIYIFSGLIELYILVTFLPRFYQIYSGTHDTFE